jgi:hypothetical protein
MSHATGSFRAGRLTQAQYMAQVERFWRRLGVNTAGQQLFPPTTPASAQPPSASAEDDTSWISQLRKLAQLHDQGVLSDADYAAAKQRVIQHKDQLP